MDAFRQHHPVVGFVFFMLMIVLSLASMHPVFQLISFVAVVAYAIAVSGIASFLRGNWWVIFLILIVTVANGIFSGRGFTVLAKLNLGFMQTAVTTESIFYGFVMGLMLANVILWFNLLGKVSSLQGIIELFARFSPTAGMMVARITVFIPELLSQAKQIDKAQDTFRPSQARSQKTSEQRAGGELIPTDSAEASNKRSRRAQLSYASALSSHLMEWGMEKSLITANSMVARGYGSRKRTSYARTRLTLRDAITLGVIVVLGVAAFVCALWAGVQYQFYPYSAPLELWWGYAPFVLLCFVPIALQIREELAWWQSK